MKTRLQASQTNKYVNFHRLIPDGGFIRCSQEIYRNNGVRGFWIGFAACSYRAFIVGAIKFTAYELASQSFKL